MLWPIGSCQNRVCADQHHMTVARAQVSTHRGCEFFEVIRLQVAGFQLIPGSTPSGFLCNDCKCIVWSKLQIYQRVLRLFPWLNLYIRLEFFFLQRGHTILFLGVAVVIALFPYVITMPIKRQVCPHIKNYHHMNSSEPLPIRINYQIFKVTSNFPSNVQIVQLFCKTGYFLGLNNIAKKNRIVGILNQSSENSKFFLIICRSFNLHI